MKADDLRSLERTERMMVRWMCGVSLKDRKRSEDLYNLLGQRIALHDEELDEAWQDLYQHGQHSQPNNTSINFSLMISFAVFGFPSEIPGKKNTLGRLSASATLICRRRKMADSCVRDLHVNCYRSKHVWKWKISVYRDMWRDLILASSSKFFST